MNMNWIKVLLFTSTIYALTTLSGGPDFDCAFVIYCATAALLYFANRAAQNRENGSI